jgi:hypothetical protein
MTDLLDGDARSRRFARPGHHHAINTARAAATPARSVNCASHVVPRLVPRCAACQAVDLRVERMPGGAGLDLHGIGLLQVELPPAD